MGKFQHYALFDKLITAQPNVLIIDHKFLALLLLVFDNEHEFFVSGGDKHPRSVANQAFHAIDLPQKFRLISNRWYKPGIPNSIHYQLPSGRQILIFSTPYLLASKIEAFTGRGGDKFYFSSDIEDIVAVLDGRSNLFEEVQQANGEVKAFLSEWFRAELENLCEIAPAFLSPAARNSGHDRLVLQTIERLAISVDY